MSGSTILIVDPIGEPRISGLQLAPRPESLEGLTVGLVSNGWWSFNVVQHHYEELLKERCGVGDVVFVNVDSARIKERGFRRSDNPSQINGNLDAKSFEELASKCDVVINGLGN
ncbi:MAG: hypothetical protein HYX94_11120 [Chloroflexi bacterium]|nr:hypothetical protein [Chloroflexota bacterium]